MEKKSVIIIGAGIGGLALAGMLGKKGYQVTIVEKNEMTGGRARIFTDQGFMFDMGPSWYMMPDVFEHFFSVVGEDINEYYRLEKLSPSYQITLKSDGKSYKFYADMEKNKALFESIEPGAGQVLEDFLNETKWQYELSKAEFMYKNYNSIRDFMTLRVMRQGAKLPLFKKQKQIINKKFKSEILRKALQYQTVLLGTAPGDTPGIYTLMNYVDLVLGEWYPDGGIRAVPQSLEAIARKYGAVIKLNAPVQQIVVENDVAKGVLLENGETIYADMIVSNADVHHTDTRLLPSEYQTKSDKYWDSRVLAPSAFILYLGVKGKLPQMEHHNLLFTKNWEEGFDQIFKKPEWPHDPSMYVCVPSKTDASIAPADHENLFVLVPIASGLDYDDTFAQTYGDKVLAEIAQYYNIPDLTERIVVRHHYSVKDFVADYNAFKGTALGLAHTLGQTAIFRPNNIHPTIKNMYYVGAGTNPGIGMPICLISAELAYKRIENITHPFPLEKI
ncbi:MAG: phytoene desaturase [Candidatus Pacebacteria bacterium]|nr:phytoene desaturase [Candidatus Paceibacterota bacterium]MBP9701128.1 phytoene desaturase [Candidatus Paceibacterota bacterium]